jgi:hypothetical protein
MKEAFGDDGDLKNEKFAKAGPSHSDNMKVVEVIDNDARRILLQAYVDMSDDAESRSNLRGMHLSLEATKRKLQTGTACPDNKCKYDLKVIIELVVDKCDAGETSDSTTVACLSESEVNAFTAELEKDAFETLFKAQVQTDALNEMTGVTNFNVTIEAVSKPKSCGADGCVVVDGTDDSATTSGGSATATSPS